jgi:hypothetical protein
LGEVYTSTRYLVLCKRIRAYRFAQNPCTVQVLKSSFTSHKCTYSSTTGKQHSHQERVTSGDDTCTGYYVEPVIYNKEFSVQNTPFRVGVPATCILCTDEESKQQCSFFSASREAQPVQGIHLFYTFITILYMCENSQATTYKFESLSKIQLQELGQ